jgi:hypothetical protein
LAAFPRAGWVALAALHLALVALVSCRDTFSAVALGHTLLPNEAKSAARAVETATEGLLGQKFSKYHPLRQGIGAYLNTAGIEAGYGFFAPNVPGANKISFELRYADGRVAYELPTLHGKPSALRLASLLDVIARVKDETVREGLIKYLVFAAWREHPDVSSIRAVLGTIDFPAPDAFAHGERESYEAAHVYDFTFEVKPQEN